ncbi:glycosyltransferase family 2 protein [Providencia rettgeri]
MKTKCVSVIIPNYNRANTILNSVQSILKQTYSNLEVIVIDDCSSDESIKILETIKDSRFRYYILESNSGACKARNLGVELSKGDYIAFNDSDDIWLPNKLEMQLSHLEKNNCDIIFSSFFFNDGYYCNIYPRQKIKSGFIPFKYLIRHSLASTQTIVGKSNIIKSLSFDERLKRFQDWDYILQAGKKYSLFYINKPLVHVKLQKNSLSRNNKNGLLSLNVIFNKNRRFFLKDPLSILYFLWKKIRLSIN